MQAGANVVGIVEGMDHIGAYGVHAAKIRRAGVPFYLNHTIKEARGREQVEQAVIARMQSGRIIAGTEEIIDVDAVCVAVGLRPLTELAYMAGVNHDFIPELGGFMPLHDENMESSLPGIYVAGDTAGVEEANTAMDEGRLAGIAMAQSLGYLAEEDGEAAKEIVRERLTALRQGPFGERRLQAKERILAKGEKRTVLPQETGGSSDMSILTDGYPSIEEINKATGWPDEERFARGPVAVIECVQKIPCNPCEAACPAHAITVGSPITNTPVLDREKCIGCGLCVSACSGLAIFIVDKTYSETQGTVSFPFEYLPLPEKGDEVNALNRAGEFVCRGTVIRVMNPPGNDHTPVVTIAIPKEYTDTVRTMGRLNLEDTDRAFRKAEGDESIDEEMLVCRCEEITAGEIRKAVREYEGTSVTEIKRRVRAGMGLCQGRTCGKLVTRIIQEELGKRADEVEPATNRPPVRPITFGELAGEEGGRTDEQGV